MKWFTTPANTPRFDYPDNNFIRFVSRCYYPVEPRSDIHFLELGSGAGADLRFLEEQGFTAIGIDSNPLAWANYHDDFDNVLPLFTDQIFDCVYELNTLCHIEKPPYEGIARVLKPGGKFFAIMPALNTEADLKGKGFTQLSSIFSIQAALDGLFSAVDIRPSCYPHRQRNHVNWVVEADK